MKAMVFNEFGPPDVLHYEDRPVSDPGSDDLVMQVHAVSVNRVLDVGRAQRVRVRVAEELALLGAQRLQRTVEHARKRTVHAALVARDEYVSRHLQCRRRDACGRASNGVQQRSVFEHPLLQSNGLGRIDLHAASAGKLEAMLPSSVQGASGSEVYTMYTSVRRFAFLVLLALAFTVYADAEVYINAFDGPLLP